MTFAVQTIEGVDRAGMQNFRGALNLNRRGWISKGK